jgi:outer membrane protein assembly factor BamE (lipoprotein component of BamABCDE complex)
MIIKLIPAIISVAIISSCSHKIEYHGKNLNKEIVGNIKPKQTNKDHLLELIGPASITSLYGKEKWYYISFKREIYGFMPSKTIQTKIVEIDFDDNKVENINIYKIPGEGKVEIDKDITVTYGTQKSVITHFSKNFRRFSKNGQSKKNPSSAPKGI